MSNATITSPTTSPTTGIITDSPITASTSAHSTRHPVLWRAGAVAGAIAAAATTVVAAAARAADIPLTIDGEEIPLAGFAQLTVFATVIGVVLGRVLSRRARRPQRTFTVTTVALTCLSLVPDLLVNTTAGSRVTLMLTHVVAAAIVIPTLATRLAD